jgi:hypothetical protein
MIEKAMKNDPTKTPPGGGNNQPQAVSDEPELHPFVSLVVQSFDREYVRVGLKASLQDDKDNVVTRKLSGEIFSLYMKVNFFTFFSLVELKQLAETVFTDNDIRAFVLNLTDVVSIASSWTEGADVEKVIEGMVASVRRTRPTVTEATKSLINVEVLNTIHIDEEELKSLYRDNFWIVVLHVLFINMQHSIVFREIWQKAPVAPGLIAQTPSR